MAANSLGVAYWRYYGAPHEKIMICPYYSNYVRIDEARAGSRADIMQGIGLTPDDKYLYSAARLVPAKGLELMIKAFLAGGYAAKGWKYVIAGIGPLEAELKALAKTGGPEAERAIMFIGFQQPTQNLSVMAHASMLALPSRFEPHGIVVAESLAAGTPVLASDITGAAHDLVKHGVNGVIFRSEDQKDLETKLAEALQADKLAALRAASRPAFEEWYRRSSPIKVVPEVVGRMLALK